MVSNKASDLFLSTGSAPALRINGKLQPCNVPPLTNSATQKMAQLIMQPAHLAAFKESPEINIAHAIPNIGRFRFNIFKQRGEFAMVVRAIPDLIPSFEELGIPKILKDIVMLRRGLVLVVGPSGTGKSTTLASMVDYRNTNEFGHVITVEDPIEYIIPPQKSIVNQREIGSDTNSYHNALINALRQSPDVIMVGEVREADIMEDVLEFADTGHLCLATLHANDAIQALDRVIHMFAKEKHERICHTLANNIKLIVSQQLIPTIYGERTVSAEILLVTPRIADLIRRGKFSDIHEMMDKDTNSGMCTMDQSLYQLYCDDRIAEETALAYATSVSNMRLQIRLSSRSTSGAR
ncbi:MAG: PilT/PilU family type 4a pilus ATPase [Thiohalomonadales bacterium]